LLGPPLDDPLVRVVVADDFEDAMPPLVPEPPDPVTSALPEP
jgi:hypothetical protein